MQGYIFEREKRQKPWVNWKNILLLVIYLLAVCGIVIGAIFFLELYKATDNVCVTKNCLKAADLIVSSMSTSQGPCDDFYQFTCGDFINHAYENNIPSQYCAQKQKIENKLSAVIAEPITGEEESIYLQLKRFYQSCMNEEAIDEAGLEPFKILLNEIGVWPLVKDQVWNETTFNLNQVIIKCIDLGLPFQWFFEATFTNGRIDILTPKIVKRYDNSYQESAYLNLISEASVHLGASKLLALNQTEKVFQFEKDLDSIVGGQYQSIAVVSLEDLNSTFSLFPWLEFLNHTQGNYTLSEYNPTINFDDEYINQLNSLLARTPKRIQADFIAYKILQEFGFYLASPIRNMFLNFTNFMTNEPQVNTRFKFCQKEVLTRFPRIAETEFIHRYVDEEKVEAIKDIISNIKEQFINKLNATKWINEQTKEIGINKIKNILEIIGQHSLNYDEKTVRDFLKLNDLEFTTDNIAEMIREKNKDDFKQQFMIQNNTEIDYLTKSFFSSTMNVNATYLEMFNIIFLPAGIIQDIYYDSKRPNYLNYGALGSIISHAIAHAFSQTATTHDSNEERKILNFWFNGTSLETINQIVLLDTTNFWDGDNLKQLNLSLECVAKDMNIFKNTKNNDRLLTETVADLIGIDIAYEAYVARAEQCETEQSLPGLPFTPKQMFWIHFGAVNCYRHLDGVIDGEIHGSLGYRVQNVLKNSKNFADDFQCPKDSVMNPTEKCHIF